MTDLNLGEWQADGHTLNLTLGLFNGRDANYGQLRVTVECPEHSSCRKWHHDHGGDADAPVYCFPAMELDAMGSPDFIDGCMNTSALPDDWEVKASEFPIEIEWRDMGEDGVAWRPHVSPPTEPPAEEQSGSLTRLAEGMA